jgi:hypothetical protein
MVPAAVNSDDSSLLHLLAIFPGGLPGECDDSLSDQDLSGSNYHRGELNQPGIS